MSAAPPLQRTAGSFTREWDRFVASTPGGTIFQTWDWAQARTRGGWDPHPILIREADGSIRAGAIIGLRRLGPLTVGYAPRGPVWNDREALVRLLLELRAFAERAGAAFVKLNPDLAADDSDIALFHEADYREAPSDAFLHRATYRIDLRRGEEELLSRMEGRTRRAVSRSFRDGVVVERGGDPDLLERFAVLARATAGRSRFPVPTPEFLEDLRLRLVPRGGFHVSVAHLHGQDLAGAIHLSFAGRRSYMWGGSTSERQLRCANGSERIQWDAMLAARRAGESTFDLHGVPMDTQGVPAGGLHLFKRGFGGELIRLVGDLDLPIRRPLYRAWLALQPLYLRRKRAA